MKNTVMLDKAGRVVIPKILRDELRLEAGDTLALESDGDGLTLRAVRSASALRKEHGVWVLRRGGKLLAKDTDRALEDSRHQREREADGSSG